MFLSGVPYSQFSAHDFIAISPSSSCVLPEDTSKRRQEVHHLPLPILNLFLSSFYCIGMTATCARRIGPLQTIGINRINTSGNQDT